MNDNLTEREKHILLLISEGLTNRMIAEKLSFTHGTIRNHVSVILNKLQCTNRAELAAYAAANRQTSAPDTTPQILEIYNRLANYSHRTAAAVIEALNQ